MYDECVACGYAAVGDDGDGLRHCGCESGRGISWGEYDRCEVRYAALVYARVSADKGGSIALGPGCRLRLRAEGKPHQGWSQRRPRLSKAGAGSFGIAIKGTQSVVARPAITPRTRATNDCSRVEYNAAFAHAVCVWHAVDATDSCRPREARFVVSTAFADVISDGVGLANDIGADATTRLADSQLQSREECPACG